MCHWVTTMLLPSIESYCASLDFPSWFLLVARCPLTHLYLSYGHVSSPVVCVAADSWFLCVFTSLYSSASQPCVFLYLLQRVVKDLDFSASILPHCFICFSIYLSLSLMFYPTSVLSSLSVTSSLCVFQKSLWFLIPMLQWFLFSLHLSWDYIAVWSSLSFPFLSPCIYSSFPLPAMAAINSRCVCVVARGSLRPCSSGYCLVARCQSDGTSLLLCCPTSTEPLSLRILILLPIFHRVQRILLTPQLQSDPVLLRSCAHSWENCKPTLKLKGVLLT